MHLIKLKRWDTTGEDYPRIFFGRFIFKAHLDALCEQMK
jgi:hypothetical protein